MKNNCSIDKYSNLFGEEEFFIQPPVSRKRTIFEDYEGFTEKFKPKKTTDDCYTPPEVYSCVLKYVSEKCGLEGAKIVRPFYPGGDYERCDYPEGCAVVDNPPFSIILKIARFYVDRGIRFFLFAPHLTLFNIIADCTRIVVGARILYTNGAKVNTSFISNMFGDIAVMGDADLYRELREINRNNNIRLPQYEYPGEVLTVSDVEYSVHRGVSTLYRNSDVYRIRALDSQKKYKKEIFGSGYLLSAVAATKKAAAKKAAADKDETIVWELSERERQIIKQLGKQP